MTGERRGRETVELRVRGPGRVERAGDLKVGKNAGGASRGTNMNQKAWKWFWRGLALSAGAGVLGVLWLFWMVGCLGREGRAMRACLTGMRGVEWAANVEVRVHPVMVRLARVVALHPRVPSEAREILAVVRNAEVGVYGLRRGKAGLGGLGRSLVDLDARMGRMGYDRWVGVVDEGRLVGVYGPRGATLSGDTRVCVGVIDDQQAVLVAATFDPEALVAFLDRRMEKGMGPMFSSVVPGGGF